MSLEKDYYDAQVRIAALEKLVSKAEQENVALRAKIAKLEAAISWALGEAGADFRGRGEGEGAYWWRKEFRIRARGREGE